MKTTSRAILWILVVLVAVGCQSSVVSSQQSATDGEDAVVPGEHDGAGDKSQGSSPQPGYVSPVPVIVTEDDDPMPAGCSPRQAAAIVATFVEAFNRGDRETLDRLFAPLPESRLSAGVGQDLAFSYFLGEVYAKNKGRTFDFDYGEKDRLLEYFAKRHRIGERMQLWKVQSSGGAMEGEKNTVGMTFLYSRLASDLKPGLGGPERLVYGKGSIDCERQTIFGWTATMEMVGVEGLELPPAPWVVSGDTDEVFCKEPSGWKPGESVLACT